MSRFSGRQYKGALRVLREIKREEAEARQKESTKKKAFDEMRGLDDELTDVLSGEEVEAVIEEMKQNENPGPALPGLAKRARKITRK